MGAVAGKGELNGSSDQTGWTAARGDTFDVRGLGLPPIGKNLTAPTTMTGEQLFQTLSYLAQSGNKQWGNIRNLLIKTGAYGKSAPDFSFNWSSADINATQDFLVKLHNYNAVSPTAQPVSDYMNQQAKLVHASGIAAGAKAPITVPATADLINVAEKAFQTTLNRNPTPAESAKFAKQFQDMVLAYGDTKKTAKIATAFAAPEQPIAFQEPSVPVTKPSAITTKKTSAIQEPIQSGTAAQNFAARTNPAEASAAAAASSLDQFLTMLKG